MGGRTLTFFALAGLLAGSQFAVQASAQSFNIPAGGFTTSNVCANSSAPAAACQVLTNGAPNRPQVASGGVLRLTTATQNQHGSVWFKLQQPLSTGFTTAFQFQISRTNSCSSCSFPADGLALVIQNDPAGTGAIGYTGNGQNMAYGNNDVSTASGPGAAIRNSLAIELDTFQNTNFGDPDGNHVAVQSCGPNNGSTLTPNSADHNYACPDGNLAKLALQSLPAGMSLTDGLAHTITVNYLPPGTCTNSCNNLSVYFDSTLVLQTTVDITKQLNLTGGSSAYLGFTAATGAFVENNDIVSWSFSQWPLAPITITQPVQPTVTNFNYTSNLSAVTDYSQSGLPASSFQGLFMQGTVTAITDQQFADLVANTPFQGSTCQHQDTGNGTFSCVTTTDLCTTPTNSVPTGANCLTTGTTPLIVVSNTYDLDPAQKPVIAPGYIMGKDNALSCGANADNTCKGLVSIFTSINGDRMTSSGGTNNFNSVLIPIVGGVQPSTSITTNPTLNAGWTNGNVTVNFNGTEIVPGNNTGAPSTLPTVTSINYKLTGPNLPSPPSGTITGATGSINLPVTTEGTTTIAYAATDSSNVVETVVTNSGNNVSSSTPSFIIKVDLTPPTLTCTPPPPAWQATDVIVPCMATDSGSGVAGPTSFNVQTNVPSGMETNSATIAPVTVKDIAGNTSAPQPVQGSFGPFEVDKAAPVITTPTILPASPVFGQSLTATYSCADGGSGVVLCGPAGSQRIPPTMNTGSIVAAVDSTVGAHNFTVNAQDLVGNVSPASMASYTVSKASTTTTITSISPNPALPGKPAAISVSVTGSTNVTAPTGTMTVTANTGETCTAAVSAGGCSLTFATAGMRTISASYSGDANFLASSTTAAVQVNVADFSITASPTSQTISSGHKAVYKITLTPIGGLTGSVKLACSGGPPNSLCSISPSVDNLQGAAVTSIVTLSPAKNVTHGTFTLTFTGSYGSGALLHSVSVSLTVRGDE